MITDRTSEIWQRSFRGLTSRLARAGVIASLLFLAACTMRTSRAVNQDNTVGAQQLVSNTPASSFATLPGEKSDLDKLANLWLKRSQDKEFSDYPVGVGDVLEISVQPIEELRARTVRISGDGTISLPFVGKLQASGLTQDELEQKLVEQLRQYMHSPRVTVFVREYRSRQVAVLGAVMKPGVYAISTGADTLLDMISQAGGIAVGADPRIYLIPAEPAESSRITQIVSSLPQAVLQQDPMPLILKRTEPIVIDVKQLSTGGNQQYLYLQIRPGDVIMVPGGGQVLVEGWVEKPGAYKLSQGITVAGVVAEAGGPLFPADVNTVRVIRADKDGNRNFITVDLEKIKRGETTDVSLNGGDIVELSAQTSKLIPYGFYKFFSTMINIGASVPLR
jgi:polysaccharide biosynthesis/export protein